MAANLPATQIGFPLALHLAKAMTASGRIEGYGSMFGGPPDSRGRLIAPGAFGASLREHRRAGTMPAMLWSHDTGDPIGRWVHMEEDGRGLRVVGQINTDTTRGREVLAHLKAGDFNGLSIGWTTAPSDTQRNPDGTTTFFQARLWEISVCTIPANGRARILDVASVTSERQFARLLHATGFSKSVSAKLAAGGWATLREGQSSNPGADSVRACELLARVRAATAAIKS